MRDENAYIAWRPTWTEAFFGHTPEAAAKRASHPYDLSNQQNGWPCLEQAGWRVDRFRPDTEQSLVPLTDEERAGLRQAVATDEEEVRAARAEQEVADQRLRARMARPAPGKGGGKEDGWNRL